MRGTQLLVQLVLMRFVGPEKFGTVAVVVMLITVGIGLADAGLSQCLIQSKNLNPRDISGIYYFNILAAVIVALILSLLAPAIERAFSLQDIRDVIVVLSVALVFDAFGRTHLAMLQRELEFRSILVATLPAAILSGAIAIGLAVAGAGIWALVAQFLFQKVIQFPILWSRSKWRPSLAFSWEHVFRLLPSGLRLAVANLVNTIFSALYTVIIARAYGPASLAYFQQGENVRTIVAQNMSSVVSRVAFPMFARVQDDIPQLQHLVRRSLELLALVAFSAMALLAGASGPLVEAFLGVAWLPSVPFVQIMSIAGAATVASIVCLDVVRSVGDAKLYLRLEIIKKSIYAIVLLLTLAGGPKAIAWGITLSSGLALVINIWGSVWSTRLPFLSHIRAMALPAAIAIVVFLVATASGLVANGSWLRLLLSVAAGAVVMTLGLILYRRDLLEAYHSLRK